MMNKAIIVLAAVLFSYSCNDDAKHKVKKDDHKTTPIALITVKDSEVVQEKASEVKNTSSDKAFIKSKKLPATNLSNNTNLVSKVIVNNARQGFVNFNYIKDSITINLFKPYFDKVITEPGDYKHPAFIKYLKKGNVLSKKVREELIKRCTWDTDQKNWLVEKLGSVAAILDCEFRILPTYYLTFNTVLYNQQSNLKQFYNLDTSIINYRFFKKGKFIGIVQYDPNGGIPDFYHFSANDSLSYYKTVSLKKTPIIIVNFMATNTIRKQGNFSWFGYVNNNHLFFVRGTAGHYSISNDNRINTLKKVEVKSAEEYFGTEAPKNLSFLNQAVNLGRKYIEVDKAKHQ